MAASCGTYHTLTLDDDGIVRSFGSNISGECGFPRSQEFIDTPKIIPVLPHIISIATGGEFSVCIDNEGQVWKKLLFRFLVESPIVFY